MRFNLMAWIASLSGVLLAAAFAAFLFFVPLMSVAVVSSVLLISVLMFGLGVQAGRRPIRITRHRNSSRPMLSHWSAPVKGNQA